MERFYSDRTEGPEPRVIEDITPDVWRGLTALIKRLLDSGFFAQDFPKSECPDGSNITDTNRGNFLDTLGALMPKLRQQQKSDQDSASALLDPHYTPPAAVALDVVEFAADHVAEPAHRAWHGYCRSEHLFFNAESAEKGRAIFRRDIDQLFGRNGIAFTLDDEMKVRRLGPLEARTMIHSFAPNTGDDMLDDMLSDAFHRFLSPQPQDRLDALQKLWDAFERLKTLEIPTNKKSSTVQLINLATSNPNFGERLEQEARELTQIGNNFYIRHFEHDKSPLPMPIETVTDYLFTRLGALISYLLRQTDRM